jgi:SAM-dependent methyltransferase
MEEISDLTPPEELIFVGGGIENFWTVGRDTLRQFIEVGGLRPGDRVLDVGCGVGRMALVLTGYLDATGGYEGFDIVGPGIDWCRTHVTPRFPQFRFQKADVFNSDYNSQGRCDAAEYTFPYADASFDFVFLTSVFTHMLPAAVENYLFEIARVLKPGGRCFTTFFLWNRETAALVRSGNRLYSFPYDQGVYRVERRLRPEAVVAYDEGYALSLLARYGFEVQGPVHYGSWSGRQGCFSGQDVIVASRARVVSAQKPHASLLDRLARRLRRAVSPAELLRFVALRRWHRGWKSHVEYAKRATRQGAPSSRPGA